MNVCLRAEIEEDFLNWVGPGRIARRYRISRDAIYRHAHAVRLMERRQRNIRAALERIIEHADKVKPNASAVVSAATAYANQLPRRTDRAHTHGEPEPVIRPDDDGGA